MSLFPFKRDPSTQLVIEEFLSTEIVLHISCPATKVSSLFFQLFDHQPNHIEY